MKRQKPEGMAFAAAKLIARVLLMTTIAIPSTLLIVSIPSILLTIFQPRSRGEEYGGSELGGGEVALFVFSRFGPGVFVAMLILYEQLLETSRIRRSDLVRMLDYGGGLTIASSIVVNIEALPPVVREPVLWFIPAFPLAMIAATFKRGSP